MSFLRTVRIVLVRQLLLSLTNPVWVIIGLVQPILYLAFFGPLLERVVRATPGLPPGDAWQIFVPGLLVQLGLFGTAFVGFALIEEVRAGVVERHRVTPAARAALLLGRTLRDVVVLVVQAALLVALSVPFGLRAPLGGVAVTLLLVALLGTAFSALSYAAALALRTEDALASVLNTLTVPLLLLSGILLPMSLAPTWLRTVARGNPLSYVVDGSRALFRGDVLTAATGEAVLSAVLLTAVALVVGTAAFRRASA
jgi:ABC-2 type transport system permease protein